MQNVIKSLEGMFNVIVDVLDLTNPVRYVITAIDILLVITMFIYITKIIKKTRASQIVKGILLLAFIYVVAKLSNMVILTFFLDNFMSYGIILLLIVFQPELRNVFEKIGRAHV